MHRTLEEINQERAKHDFPPLEWDEPPFSKAETPYHTTMSLKTGRKLWVFGLVIALGLLLSDIVLAANTTTVVPTMINVLYGLVAVWLGVSYILISVWAAFHWKGFFGE